MLRVGIMQPYFFPYIGYFSLIKHTDIFILFDPVQFIRHGWIDRNRILKPSTGWQYIKVPIRKHSGETIIKDIEINDDQDWKDKIFRQLEHYRKRAPYYNETLSILQEALDVKTGSIVLLNENILKVICAYIGFDFNIRVYSQMNIKIDKPKAPDEWALNICKDINGVKEYWNPEGGLQFFNTSKYKDAGIDIKFQKMSITRYSQSRKDFEGALSIIDVMMFNEPQKINDMLDDYFLL